MHRQNRLTAAFALQDLRKLADKKKSKILSRFFKTGKGEYAEGDEFLGITVPKTRALAKKYELLPTHEIHLLLSSEFHEARLLSLIILTLQYKKSKGAGQEAIVRFYLDHAKHINNWDLVDLSVYKILGDYLLERDRAVLYKLAKSSSLWKRRMAIVSTYFFIRQGDFKETFELSKLLLGDDEDLIHKAVGWMLREVGKRDIKALQVFLKANYVQLSRTTLRYAIERFAEEERERYLNGDFL